MELHLSTSIPYSQNLEAWACNPNKNPTRTRYNKDKDIKIRDLLRPFVSSSVLLFSSVLGASLGCASLLTGGEIFSLLDEGMSAGSDFTGGDIWLTLGGIIAVVACYTKDHCKTSAKYQHARNKSICRYDIDVWWLWQTLDPLQSPWRS